MDADDILRDVFADHAENRPDAAGVLAGVHNRLDHSRRPVIVRTTAVLGAAAAVAVVAGVVAVADRPAHHSSGQPAAGSATVSAVTTSTSAPDTLAPSPSSSMPVPSAPASSVTASAPAVAPSAPTTSGPAVYHHPSTYPYSTIAAGWLPGPAHQVEADNNPGFQERDYDVTVDGVDMDVIIYTESGTSLPTRTEAGSGGRDLTINGHPAREFVADNATIIAVDLGNGTIAYAGPSVDAPTATVTTARITAIAEHVARDTEFNRHDPIPAT